MALGKYIMLIALAMFVFLCVVFSVGTVQEFSRQRLYKKRAKGKVLSVKIHFVDRYLAFHCDGNGIIEMPVCLCECTTLIDSQKVNVTVQSDSPRSEDEVIDFWYNPYNPKETLEKKTHVNLISLIVTIVLCVLDLVVFFSI